jgi:hypothetical protein
MVVSFMLLILNAGLEKGGSALEGPWGLQTQLAGG